MAKKSGKKLKNEMDFPPIEVVIDGKSMDVLGGSKKQRKYFRAKKLEQDLDKQGYEPTPERQSNSKVNPIDNANRIRAGLKDGSKCKLATKGKGRAYGKNS